MKILGIHYGHDANVALIENGQIVFAIAEERLSRDKFHRGFPYLSLEHVINKQKINPNDIDYISLVGVGAQDETLGHDIRNFYKRLNLPVPIYAKLFSRIICTLDNLLRLKIRILIANNLLYKTLNKLGFPKQKIILVEHHLSHAAGAYYMSGFDEAYVFTCDGKGDNKSGQVYKANQLSFEKISETFDYNSLGLFYSCVTAHLGFKPLHHEGKITGLAAYGKINEELNNLPDPAGLSSDGLSLQNNLINQNFLNIYYIYLRILLLFPLHFFKLFTSYSAIKFQYAQLLYGKYLKKNFKNSTKEDLSAFAQKNLENTIVSLIKNHTSKEKKINIAVSGGTFGNVRLNQKILEIQNVDNIFVQQGMGDGGLAVGAALWVYKQKNTKWKSKFIEKVYFGGEFDSGDIEKLLKDDNSLNIINSNSPELEIARLISEEKIIGRFNGPMEWGPRALGNRSILASAKDANINQSLNDRLSRTEFMPFAPIIMEEHAHEYFIGFKANHIASRFMTITYDVYEEKHNLIPAVVHVDGTARPQVVRKKDNPSLHSILNEYYKLTGIPVLINTSFNIHGEPIVYNPKDALKSFKFGAVDYLAIDKFIVNLK